MFMGLIYPNFGEQNSSSPLERGVRSYVAVESGGLREYESELEDWDPEVKFLNVASILLFALLLNSSSLRIYL